MLTSSFQPSRSRLVLLGITCLALLILLLLMRGQAASSPGTTNPGHHALQQRAVDDWRICRDGGGLFTLDWSNDGAETRSTCSGGIYDNITCRVSAVTSTCHRPGGDIAATMHISNPNGNPSP